MTAARTWLGVLTVAFALGALVCSNAAPIVARALVLSIPAITFLRLASSLVRTVR
jgi:hypothetical protein